MSVSRRGKEKVQISYDHLSNMSFDHLSNMSFRFDVVVGSSSVVRVYPMSKHNRLCDGAGCKVILDDLYIDIMLALKKAKLISWKAPFYCCLCYAARDKRQRELLRKRERILL